MQIAPAVLMATIVLVVVLVFWRLGNASKGFANRRNAQGMDKHAVAPRDYSPAPMDINSAPYHRVNIFRVSGSEMTALLVVAFCQSRGGWVGFTQEDIARSSPLVRINPGFRGLVEDGFIVPGKDKLYWWVTKGFVARVHEFYPAQENVAS